MLSGEDAWPWAPCWLLESTPVIAESVFGVMVPATPLSDGGPLLFIMARKAAVLGDGGGNETGPPRSGVSPAPGVRPVRGVSPVRGVRPVRKAAGSKGARGWSGFCCWGAVSIAGLRGPDRRELERDAEENAHEYEGSEGEEMASMGGRTVLRGSVLSGEWDDLWLEPEEGREWGGWLCLSVSVEDGPMESLELGDFWAVRRDESFDGRAKDCSKGLGSRSKVDRLGRGGGRCGGFSWRVDVELGSSAGEESTTLVLSWAIVVTTMTKESDQTPPLLPSPL